MAASSLSLSSVPLPPSQPRRISGVSSSPTGGFKPPIVVSGKPPTFVSAPGRRIVAIGDLHGDLEQAKLALEMAGILSSDGRNIWVGGETEPMLNLRVENLISSFISGVLSKVLIQVGDVLDRGEDEIAILSLLKSLGIQAKAKGGAVFQVNGNHETMNVEGDFRYVDYGAFDECMDFLEYLSDFGYNWEKAFVNWSSVSQKWKEDRITSRGQWGPWSLIKKQKGITARSYLLRPGGPLACELAHHSVVLKVNDWVFCHGGLLPHHVAYGVERMNREVSCWMQGVDEDGDEPFMATRGYDSVVWNRLYSSDSLGVNYRIRQICSIVEETLEGLGAKALVVGHTPQPTGVNCKCDKKIWCIDVGMSSGILNSRPEVLEIIDNNARVLRIQKDSFGGLEADYL